ncbi:MAG TPA: flippase activity-associated protein Agl23 [Chthoniobacterales bacterium]|nr:flippase activity-associated protein Agl23 [Chthoniobacterales bacterium]
MNPQPPVTNMRIAAGTSSGAEAAPPVSPTLPERWEHWKQRAAGMDWTPWMIVALGAFIRFFLLAIKPPHFDEGINGWFVDQMVKNGFYRYDPTNYHGPLHFYILFLSQTLFGRNLWAIRLPVVLASIFSIHLTLKFEPFVGRKVSRLAALAMAVSPAFVFYGRYSIHEVWLLLFSMLFILGLLGLWQRGTVNYLWCAGMGFAGMILTKETYIIHVGCAVIAGVVLWVSHKITPLPNARPARQSWTSLDLLVVAGVGAAAIIFFYSGAFLNWPGVAGLFKTFAAWFKTGSEGAGHDKPWHYWLMLMNHYEPAIALGVAGCLLCQFFREVSLRFLAIFGVGTLMAYSIIHYKTPWCIISIIWPFLFIFGALPWLAPLKLRLRYYVGYGALLFVLLLVSLYFTIWKDFQFLWSYFFVLMGVAVISMIHSHRKTLTSVLILLPISLVLCVRLNYFRCTTDTEPYVYVQTYNDVWKLTKPLLRLAKSNPTYYQLVGHLIRTSTYPLPWMLGDFTKVGYYEHNNMPAKLDADFLIVQEDKIEEVESKLQGSYYTEPLTIRPYQDPSKLYLSAKVFHKIFPGRVPDFSGKPAAEKAP